MSKSISHRPVLRIIVTAIALSVTGLGIYAITTPSKHAIAIAIAGTAPAASTKIAAANNAGSANPLLPDRSTPGNASATPLTAVPDVHDHTVNTPSVRDKEALTAMLLPADYVPVSDTGTTENAPFARITLDGVSSGSQAIAQLGANLEPVAKWYGMSSTEFHELLLHDNSVHVDSKGRVLYIDEGGEFSGGIRQRQGSVPAAGHIQAAQQVTFQLRAVPEFCRSQRVFNISSALRY